MALIKRHNFEKHGSFSTAHYDPNYDEYTVKFHFEGIHRPQCDYFTDDKEDAIATMQINPTIPAEPEPAL